MFVSSNILPFQPSYVSTLVVEFSDLVAHLVVNCINVHCDAEIRGYCLFLLITTGLFPIKVLLTLFCIRLEDVSLYLDSLLSDILICYHLCCWLLLSLAATVNCTL